MTPSEIVVSDVDDSIDPEDVLRIVNSDEDWIRANTRGRATRWEAADAEASEPTTEYPVLTVPVGAAPDAVAK